MGHDSSLNLLVIYKSPNSTNANNELLLEVLRDIRGPTLIVGDFNYPGIDWTSHSGPGDSQKLIDLSLDKFWEQNVTFPTHKSGNILDLVFSDSGLVGDINNDGQLGSSDHCIVTIDTNSLCHPSVDRQMKFNYRRADFAKNAKPFPSLRLG